MTNLFAGILGIAVGLWVYPYSPMMGGLNFLLGGFNLICWLYLVEKREGE